MDRPGLPAQVDGMCQDPPGWDQRSHSKEPQARPPNNQLCNDETLLSLASLKSF